MSETKPPQEPGRRSLGVVGTGLMGSAIVRRLRALGHGVTIWKRGPEALPPLLALGATGADSPRDVGERAEIVLLCVLDGKAVGDCVFGPDGIATVGRDYPGLLVDLSTIDPALEATILADGPDTIAAFIAEPINAGGGIVVPPAGYVAKVQAVLRRHDVQMLADEIAMGDTIGFCPPLIIDEAGVDEAVGLFALTLSTVEAGLPAQRQAAE